MIQPLPDHRSGTASANKNNRTRKDYQHATGQKTSGNLLFIQIKPKEYRTYMAAEKSFDRPDEWNVRNIRQGRGLAAEFAALIIERGKQGLGPLTLKDGEERVRFMKWAQEDGWGVSEAKMDKKGNVHFTADYDSAGRLIPVEGDSLKVQETKKTAETSHPKI